ncbi:pentatricopeptide repeat-containing protein At3g24000, mitochondrial [Dendrobium catenatum]|uniref:Pentatricopeptide repeat-containing protein n=1 Tax=Dendrobium catenatum TaxID=906689 RepID=A0A2I0XCB6_9ASPA|nr:pentatricopeptide repeat-containing protein At3g24000, mitochondrial [Dendrobium catenatum]PKU85562.1 Pentatricopeptide repeat-containing protein [Dendrobium catenatum]
MIRLSWARRKFLSLSQVFVPFSHFHEAIAGAAAEVSPCPAKKSYLDLTLDLSDAIKFSSRLSESQKIHARLIFTGFSSSLFLQNTLLHSYFSFGAVGDARRLFDTISSPNTITCNIMVTGLSKSGNLEDARQVFDEMPVRDAASWNSLMTGYYSQGKFEESIEIFASMICNALEKLDIFSLTVSMKAVGALQCYELSLRLHVLAKKLGFENASQVKRSLIDMNIKCGAADIASKIFKQIQSPDLFCWNSMILCYMELYGVEHALKVFNSMPERDIISWNTVISILSQQGHYWETISMIINMQVEGYRLSSTTYTCGLTACANFPHLDWGKHLHAVILKSEAIIDVFVGSALVDMYAKCGHLDTARRTFDSLSTHNIVSWTSLIGGYAQFGKVEEAGELFNKMRREQISFDKFTLSTIISACYNGTDSDVHFGCQLHCLCFKTGYSPSTPVSNALLTMYAKCERIESSESIFKSMASRDVVSWTSMITAYAQFGNVGKAREFFDSMSKRNVITWNAIFGAYMLNEQEEEALKLFIVMLREDDVRPDWVTFVRLLSAAADMGALKIGTQVIAHTMKLGFNDSNTSVANGIITMYSKSGKIVEARQVFDSITNKDLISWNALITAYAQHGLGREAVKAFEKMLLESIQPDYISYVAVLSGCSHSGLVSQGKSYFERMTGIHGIVPGTEHFACMVDLLGRAGFLQQAKEVIVNMPIEPTAEVWGAMLGACKLHNNTELADFAAKHIFQLDSKDSGSYILLAKLYADVGNFKNSAGVRRLMKEKGIRKKPGCSWIEVDNRIHAFIAEDLNHPQINDILIVLGNLFERIKAFGYVNQDSCSRSTRHHSEKLAMAFGLMSLPPWMPVHIMKNLRICSDCHSVIKLVSLICKREIVVRDAIRFHHFKDGSCSCCEYW